MQRRHLRRSRRGLLRVCLCGALLGGPSLPRGALAGPQHGDRVLAAGEQILAHAADGSLGAQQALEQILDTSREPLVVAWAAAALAQRAHTPEAMSALLRACQAADARLVRHRTPRRARTPDERTRVTASVRLLLHQRLDALAAHDPMLVFEWWRMGHSLSESLHARFVALPPEAVVHRMLHDPDDRVRRDAASALPLLAASGHELTRALVDALPAPRWGPRADAHAPWSTGALFVPRLAWERPEREQLTSRLIAWVYWSKAHQHPDTEAQALRALAALDPQIARMVR